MTNKQKYGKEEHIDRRIELQEDKITERQNDKNRITNNVRGTEEHNTRRTEWLKDQIIEGKDRTAL